ncbi:MTH1187 family thiamine-binding protein [Candidatus Sumerlaeota bacterium]|nr:MTH1187 family thiamine-binding protein [Candidatus Sumerlaeota bacterium]
MIAEFTVVPLDKGAHLSKWVAPILEIVAESGVSYQFTAMGTILEGDWDEVMSVVRRCHERMREISERVITTVKIDDHAGHSGRMRGKVESVERELGRELSKD